ncbi:MAG TPA: hypothetical protein VL947_02955, partial [Cytophagales bacterium]|nr:hypothetical protein [Cytophagales bacterium]
MVTKLLKLGIVAAALCAVGSCKKKNSEEKPCGWTDITFASASQDVVLGQQVDSTILSTPAEYPILDPAKYPLVY